MFDILAQFTLDGFLNTLMEQAAVWGPKILLAIFTLFVGWKIAGWVGNMLGKAIDKRKIDPTLKPFLTSLLSAIIRAGVVVTAITTAGIEATSFAAIFAAMGLAIGMALSGTLQNFAGGIVLLIVRPFKVGDVIEAQGFIGTVKVIEIFQTILLTGDNKMVHIPNGKLQNDSLINYSSMPTRRVDFTFGIGYDDDIRQAREVIMGVINKHEEIHKTPEPTIRVAALADSSVNLSTRVWCDTADYWTVHFALNEEVKYALDEAGISIPYPQSDLHIISK